MTSSLGVCQFCGRQNEAAAHFCSDCGKPLTKAAASRAAVGAGGAAAGIGARTTDPSHQHSPAHGTVAPDAPCPVCGSVPARTAGGGAETAMTDGPSPIGVPTTPSH